MGSALMNQGREITLTPNDPKPRKKCEVAGTRYLFSQTLAPPLIKNYEVL